MSLDDRAVAEKVATAISLTGRSGRAAAVGDSKSHRAKAFNPISPASAFVPPPSIDLRTSLVLRAPNRGRLGLMFFIDTHPPETKAPSCRKI
jgi:hypothetical protein